MQSLTVIKLFLEKNSFQKVFILYPDPWPKKKHFKRRLISLNWELVMEK